MLTVCCAHVQGMERVPNFIHDGFYEHFVALDMDKNAKLTKEVAGF